MATMADDNPFENPFEKLLLMFTTKSPVFPNDFGTVAKLTADTQFPAAVAKLVKARVMAMPVVEPGSMKALAWFGVEDLTHMLLKRFSDDELKKHDVGALHELRDELKGATLQDLVKELTPIAKGNSIEYAEDRNMFDAAKRMAAQHRHRIAVLEADGKVANVLTQSRAVALLGVVVEQMELGRKTVGELKLGLNHDQLFTVNEDAQVRDAFKLMDEHTISSVGVVNSKGQIVGNISLRDVKNFGFDARFYYLLGQSVRAWLNEIRLCDPLRTIPDSQDPIRVKEKDTFARVVTACNHFKIHRVWVVDSNDKPIGLVSLTDILSAALP